VDPVDEAVAEVELDAEVEDVMEMIDEAAPAIAAVAEAAGISETEAAIGLLSATAAMIEANAEAGIDPDIVGLDETPATESAPASGQAAAGGEPRQAPGDTTA
jgi:hypothetical protein